MHEDGNTFHCYLTAPASLAKDALFVCHHGAGSSGLSFALFASHLKRLMPTAGILSIDARGHGFTSDLPSNGPSATSDLSLKLLSQDLVRVIHATQRELKWQNLPNLLFVGHSLGGAVVTDVAKHAVFGAKLIGFAVLDVVEGSAIEALNSMQSLLARRPSAFPSIDSAIDWHVRSRTIRDRASAQISTPPLLRQTESGKWIWRTDLAGTKSFWEEWFTGMSQKFLLGKAAKLLVLAGTDRLDKDLMIGQMQGKFQLVVEANSGHFIQEDQAEKLASIVSEFYKRNDRSALILPPKVSDMLKQGKKI